MIVVSDTSPLTALLTVGEADLLPGLFHEVVIPEGVLAELRRSHPSLPDWLRGVFGERKARVIALVRRSCLQLSQKSRIVPVWN